MAAWNDHVVFFDFVTICSTIIILEVESKRHVNEMHLAEGHFGDGVVESGKNVLRPERELHRTILPIHLDNNFAWDKPEPHYLADILNYSFQVICKFVKSTSSEAA